MLPYCAREMRAARAASGVKGFPSSRLGGTRDRRENRLGCLFVLYH